MKKIISIPAMVFLLSLTVTLFTSNSVQAQENNGVIVDVYKNGVMRMYTHCGVFETNNTTLQMKNGEAHVARGVFSLPPDSCVIKKRAYVEYWGPWKMLFTPSGQVIATYVGY